MEGEHQLVEKIREFKRSHPNDYVDRVPYVYLINSLNYTRECMRHALNPLGSPLELPIKTSQTEDEKEEI